MANDVAIPGEDLETYGPAMQAISARQRRFVIAYCEHPNYTQGQLAEMAGYTVGVGSQIRVIAHQVMHNEKVIAAINEETSKRLRSAGLIGVSAIIAIALNPAHKDHLKAAGMLADRTGFHAMSEHKVTVDDKRPQTKQELITAVRNVAKELGMDDAAIKKFTGEDVIEAEFVEVDVDVDIAKQMEDL